MAANDPGIGQLVVAEEGFTPVGIVPLFRSCVPEGRGCLHVRLIGEDF